MVPAVIKVGIFLLVLLLALILTLLYFLNKKREEVKKIEKGKQLDVIKFKTYEILPSYLRTILTVSAIIFGIFGIVLLLLKPRYAITPLLFAVVIGLFVFGNRTIEIYERGVVINGFRFIPWNSFKKVYRENKITILYKSSMEKVEIPDEDGKIFEKVKGYIKNSEEQSINE